MCSAAACLADQAFILWRTEMPVPEIAARLGVPDALVQSWLQDVGGAAATAPAADRLAPSGATTRRSSVAPRPKLSVVAQVCTP
jgi:hypothetical protein